MNMDAAGRHIAIFLPSLAAGGVGRSYVELANGFRTRGARVDFLLGRARGEHLAKLDPSIPVIELGTEGRLATRRCILRAFRAPRRALLLPVLLAWKDAPACASLGPLARYLERERPEVLLAGKTHANLTAIWARELAGAGTRIVVSERTQLSEQIARKPAWRWQHIAPVVARSYPLANAITAVSHGVADDLAETARLDRSCMQTLYNPFPTETLRKRAVEASGHPWLEADELEVVLGVGRLVAQKDFEVLLEAFALLADARPRLRLVVLGEGERRGALEQRIARLGLQDRVSLPGYSDNPYAFMARARVLVLSSSWEGLPGVLIEAMACGCPVVSSDCESGPREILAGGRYGELVPPGDASALAGAVGRVLEASPQTATLVARAEMFAADAAIDRYLRVLLEAPSDKPHETNPKR